MRTLVVSDGNSARYPGACVIAREREGVAAVWAAHQDGWYRRSIAFVPVMTGDKGFFYCLSADFPDA